MPIDGGQQVFEAFQGRLDVFDDVGGENVGIGQVVEVGQGFVFEPEDVEVGFVAGDDVGVGVLRQRPSGFCSDQVSCQRWRSMLSRACCSGVWLRVGIRNIPILRRSQIVFCYRHPTIFFDENVNHIVILPALFTITICDGQGRASLRPANFSPVYPKNSIIASDLCH